MFPEPEDRESPEPVKPGAHALPEPDPTTAQPHDPTRPEHATMDELLVAGEPTDTPATTEPVAGQPVGGGVRWRRFAGMLAAGTLGGLALVILTAQGVLAAQFSISGLPFIVTASKLEGSGFEQYATIDHMPEGSPNAGDTGGQIVVIVSAVRTGTMTNLCQSVSLGGVNLKLTAGTGKEPVRVTNMVADSDQIDGDITFGNMAIGQDASTLTQVPGAVGNLGVFGQQAETFTIVNLRQRNYAVTAGSFTLPDLKMRFTAEGC